MKIDDVIRELQHISKEHGNHPIKDDIISLDAMPVRIKESQYGNELVGFHRQNISNTSLVQIIIRDKLVSLLAMG